MNRLTQLGLIAACLIAACTSRDSLLYSDNGGGGSGSGNGGTSGAGGGGRGGAAGPGTGGTSGVRACEMFQCARPYECVRSCGGAIEYTGCCMCEAPLFDNFMGLGCGGSSGARGGTTGSAGTGGAGGGRAGTGGTGGVRACEQFQCARPYECVRACGGPIEYTGCCMCDPPLFDDFQGRACGDGGQAAVSYVGCTYIGGYNRIVISKRDVARDLCFNVVLVEPGPPPAGLTTPASTGLEWATVGPASACPARSLLNATRASGVTGTVTEVGTTGQRTAMNIDVMVTFGANDAGAPPAERLSAQNVDVRPGCVQ
jgi:hypothetical protein